MPRLVSDTDVKVAPWESASQDGLDLRRLYDADCDAVVILDGDLRYRYANREATKRLGWSESELLGRRIWEVFPGLQDSLVGRTLSDVMRDAATGRAASALHPSVALPGTWYESRFVPIGLDSTSCPGEFGVACFMRDVSEQVASDSARIEEFTRYAERAERQERIGEALQRSLLMMPEMTAASVRSAGTWKVASFHAAAEPHSGTPGLPPSLRSGGDFFDIFPVDETRTAFITGDVTGKGPEAAAMVPEVRYALRTLLRACDGSPSAALDALNQHLVTSRRIAKMDTVYAEEPAFARETFVCLTVIVIDHSTQTARIGIAGGEPPLYHPTPDTLQSVPLPAAHGLVLGAWPEWLPDGEEVAFPIPVGATLALVTDGITEARRLPAQPGIAPDLLGPERAAWLVRQASRNGESVEGIANALVDGARRHSGGKLNDDVCFLILRRLA